MGYCVFDEGAALFDATPVDNMFITEYMLRAPGDFVKVYLYALMLCSHPSERMSDAAMAKDLDLQEEDVQRAFQYWARAGLVRQIGDNPRAYAILSAKQLAMSRCQSPSEQLYHRGFMDEVRRILGGRVLTESECHTIFDWTDVLELPEEVVLMFLRIEMEQSGGKVSIRVADEHAKEWARRGIRTVEDVEQMEIVGKERERELRKLLGQLGQRRDASDPEKKMYRKWRDEWGFSAEAIREALRETTKGVPTMAYLEGILRRQHQQGRHGVDALSEGMRSENQVRDFVRKLLQALGRVGIVPTEEDVALVEGWRSAGVEEALMELAARSAHRHSSAANLEDVGGVIERWRARGLDSAEAVQRETERVRALNGALREIYEAAGLEKRPSAADRERLCAWQGDGHPRALILLAAEYAKARPAPMQAMATILEAWRKADIRTEEAARTEHERHQAARPQAAPVQQGYQRRDYTEQDYRSMEVDLDAEEDI